jgi:thiamine pyrophosphate-dependent acetolactate synthase large subunit-like protein
MNVADYLVSFLSMLGVKHVYGYPGSPLVPLLAALQRQDAVRWVLMRHENAAAMAAGAHARLTGQLGVCVATSGPGALNFVCGVVDSHLDRVPVLALTGLVPTSSQGHWEFQDVNQTGLFSSVLAHSATCIHPNQLVILLRNFVGAACQQQQTVHMALPSDVLATEVSPGDEFFRLDPAMLPRPLSLMPPPAPAFEVVAKDLEAFRRPVIVLGRRALGCGPAIEQLAEKLGAPVITSLDGKGIVDESHPHALGVLGIFGFPAVAATTQLLRQADVIVAFGVDTIKPFLTDAVNVQRRALIQCESDFVFLTQEYHRDRTLVGPLSAIADGLRDRVRPRPRNPVLDALAAERAEFQTRIAEESALPKEDRFLHPREFLLPLSAMLPAESVLILDTGAHTLWAAQYVQLRRRQRIIVSSHLGTMGFSLPAAIAAQLAAPERPVVAICGDGGFQMVVGELATAVQHQLPLIIIIFNNGILQNVLAQQVIPHGTHLVNPDFVALAHAYGADGVTVDAKADIPAILQEAFQRPRRRPFLIDLRVDPELMFPLSKWDRFTPIPLP